MSNLVEVIDICESLARKCQAQVKGSRTRLRCNQYEMPAEEAFAADKLFPVFLDMAMKLPPEDPDLQVGQYKNFNTVFDIQAVVPSCSVSKTASKWETRLRRVIDTYIGQSLYSSGLVDLSSHFNEFATSISTDKIPTFDNVESALAHFSEAKEQKLRQSIDICLDALAVEELDSPNWAKCYRAVEMAVKARYLPDDLQKKCVAALEWIPPFKNEDILTAQTGLVDLVDELSEYCLNLGSTSPLKYRIQGNALSIKEAFAPDCTLPIFLFLAKELPPADNELRLYHYRDDKAVLEARPLVPDSRDASTYGKWKERLTMAITTLEQDHASRDGFIDLDQPHSKWHTHTAREKPFEDIYSVVEFPREGDRE